MMHHLTSQQSLPSPTVRDPTGKEINGSRGSYSGTVHDESGAAGIITMYDAAAGITQHQVPACMLSVDNFRPDACMLALRMESEGS